MPFPYIYFVLMYLSAVIGISCKTREHEKHRWLGSFQINFTQELHKKLLLHSYFGETPIFPCFQFLELQF